MPYLQERLVAHTTCHIEGEIFRGAPMHSGPVWRDWVVIDWGEDGVLPCKIWGFVDLRGISEQETDANIGGLNQVSPGIYGIAESANPIRRERFSEIFVEFTKKTVQMQG